MWKKKKEREEDSINITKVRYLHLFAIFCPLLIIIIEFSRSSWFDHRVIDIFLHKLHWNSLECSEFTLPIFAMKKLIFIITLWTRVVQLWFAIFNKHDARSNNTQTHRHTEKP